MIVCLFVEGCDELCDLQVWPSSCQWVADNVWPCQDVLALSEPLEAWHANST